MKLVLFVYFLFAGVTWVSGEEGRGLLGRLAISDVLLLLIMCTVLLIRPRSIRVSRLGLAAIGMLAAFSLGMINTRNVVGTTIEWMIHAFSIAGFIVLNSVVARLPFAERLEVAGSWVRAATVLAIFGLYEFVGVLLGAPSILVAIGQPPLTSSGLVGTFRNTGQSGFFFAVALATAIPLHRVVRGPLRTEMLVSILILGLALMFTVKRSAMIGVAVGVVLFFLMDPSIKGRIRSAAVAAGVSALVIPGFIWMMESSALYRGRIDYKLGVRGTEVVAEFARENVGAAARAFSAHPVLGVGLGGIQGVWTDQYELHSTFLAVPAQAGIVGTVAYVWFMVVFFRSCTRSRNGDRRAWMLGKLFLPLLLGLTLSFGYTYHLRKREFWITAAIASALMAPEAARAASGRRRYEWEQAVEPLPTGPLSSPAVGG